MYKKALEEYKDVMENLRTKCEDDIQDVRNSLEDLEISFKELWALQGIPTEKESIQDEENSLMEATFTKLKEVTLENDTLESDNVILTNLITEILSIFNLGDLNWKTDISKILTELRRINETYST